ncbi:MAG TPA: hypothetical protein VHG29_03995 [Novosphingobium sp.]|nr:hypothetical protein [Novosphingobium sp.]
MFAFNVPPRIGTDMRKPETIEHLYLDFDGFFASVEQLRDPSLRGRPVGVVPYEGGKSCIIACSREAKARGVKNIMMVDEARRLCRDLVLVPQKPDLREQGAVRAVSRSDPPRVAERDTRDVQHAQICECAKLRAVSTHLASEIP